MHDKPAAKNRPKTSGYGCETRPCPDRPATSSLGKVCTYKGQASRHQQSGTNALHCTGRNQIIQPRRQATPNRRKAKQSDAYCKYAPPAKTIAERAANKNERG